MMPISRQWRAVATYTSIVFFASTIAGGTCSACEENKRFVKNETTAGLNASRQQMQAYRISPYNHLTNTLSCLHTLQCILYSMLFMFISVNWIISPLKSWHTFRILQFCLRGSRLQYEWSSDCWCIWKSFWVNACLEWRKYFDFIG
jgi:hypothetical protein